MLGPWAAMASLAAHLNGPPGVIDPPFLSVNIINMIAFAGLLAWGIVLRKNPAAHRRIMILTTVAIADPGFARFSGYLWPNEPHSILIWFLYTFYGNALIILLMAAWDWYRNRLIRSFVLASAGLLAAEFAASVLYFCQPWRDLTLTWVQLWAKHFA